MRLDTPVWIRCESKGRPADTIQRAATIRDCIMIAADWLSKVYMGSHIEIRIARSEADLHRSTRAREMATLGAELETMLAGTGGTPELERETIELEQDATLRGTNLGSEREQEPGR